MRVRIIKQHPKYRRNQIIEVTRNVGFGLIDAGYAIVDKSITSLDTRTK